MRIFYNGHPTLQGSQALEFDRFESQAHIQADGDDRLVTMCERAVDMD